MIASVLKFNCRAFKESEITDTYGIHQKIYALFPETHEGKRDFLFADKGGTFNERRILILSKQHPGVPKHGTIESKAIPASFLEFNSYAFEVRLNPVKRDSKSKKLIPIGIGLKMALRREKLAEWFIAKSEGWGFVCDRKSLQVQDVGVQTFEKQKAPQATVTQGTAVFIGTLKVTDRTLFVKSFEEGIGKGKGFGFGLLQIVPLQE
ncbi:MAG: type I-E CRISPR-associated protein Cas6/Cse3/CasE [Treponema sp.]|jgi:CRISPR system Cascade subunit CasE|nr:type I-E CRISPR-associated protein Cas6/Cse3/CasE [Treponema sp.]